GGRRGICSGCTRKGARTTRNAAMDENTRTPVAFRRRSARPVSLPSDRQRRPDRGVIPAAVNPSEGRMGVAAGVRGRTGRALRWFIAVGLLLGFGWVFATRLDPAALVRALGGAA